MEYLLLEYPESDSKSFALCINEKDKWRVIVYKELDGKTQVDLQHENNKDIVYMDISDISKSNLDIPSYVRDLIDEAYLGIMNNWLDKHA